MKQWIAAIGCLLACSSAKSEEKWFQACGPVYPIRLEGPACDDPSRIVGFEGKNVSTGVSWCCAKQILTADEICEIEIRKFVESGQRGENITNARYKGIKKQCPSQLEKLAKASGSILPDEQSAREANAFSNNSNVNRRVIGRTMSQEGYNELRSLIKFAIAISPVVNKMYPQRMMPIDHGNSQKQKTSINTYPNDLRDIEKRPSDISGVGGPRGTIYQNHNYKSIAPQPPHNGSSIKAPAASRQPDTSSSKNISNNNSAIPPSATPLITQKQAPSLKGVSLEMKPVPTSADLDNIKQNVLSNLR
ncbi:hypothetical protein FV219_00655 [Methylobacterium sp. WL122]|nr:hypothetical protein FV219_00655 [Methylobacterium sp. WL122]